MNGIEALALTLSLMGNGMDPNEASDLSLETMQDINRMDREDAKIEREVNQALSALGVSSFLDAA